MKRFNTLADMLPVRAFAPQTLRPQPNNTPDAVLGKAVCALVFNATPRFKWRGIRCLLRPAV